MIWCNYVQLPISHKTLHTRRHVNTEPYTLVWRHPTRISLSLSLSTPSEICPAAYFNQRFSANTPKPTPKHTTISHRIDTIMLCTCCAHNNIVHAAPLWCVSRAYTQRSRSPHAISHTCINVLYICLCIWINHHASNPTLMLSCYTCRLFCANASFPTISVRVLQHMKETSFSDETKNKTCQSRNLG